MHEVSIMQSALQTVGRVARERNLSKVRRVCLRVGLLSGVIPDSLLFAFEVLRPGTVAADAQLDIEIVPAVFWCEACQLERRLTALDFACDLCQGTLILKGGGHELELSVVEGDAN